MRKALILVAVFGVVAASCSDQEQAEWRYGPPPACDTSSMGRLLLIAQSVPEATLIPCIGSLPTGWEFIGASSRTSESVLTFANDAVDLEVDVVLTPSCDIGAARAADSRRPGTQRYVGADGKRHVFTFEGGCITFAFETRALAESREGQVLMAAVLFLTRDELRERSGWVL